MILMALSQVVGEGIYMGGLDQINQQKQMDGKVHYDKLMFYHLLVQLFKQQNTKHTKRLKHDATLRYQLRLVR